MTASARSVPTNVEHQAADLRGDVADKEREVEASRSTAERLKLELEERRAELDRIDGLDARLEEEIADLARRRSEMEVSDVCSSAIAYNNYACYAVALRDVSHHPFVTWAHTTPHHSFRLPCASQAELPRLRDIAALKAAAEAEKASLVKSVAGCGVRRDTATAEAAALRPTLDQRRAALSANPRAAALAASELALKTVERELQPLRDSVAARRAATDYSAKKAEVLRGIAEAHVLLQRQQMRRGSSTVRLTA